MKTTSRIKADPNELFDVVDGKDCVVRQAARHEVHSQGWLHRAVHVLVHDAHGRLFLQRRSLAKDTFPGCWDSSCSGHVDAGEDYPAAARRELMEELGCGIDLPLRTLLKLPASLETGQEFIQIYLLGPYAGPFDLNPEEITEGKWITPEELDCLLEKRPTDFAGALRFLWHRNRAEILNAICDLRSHT